MLVKIKKKRKKEREKKKKEKEDANLGKQRIFLCLNFKTTHLKRSLIQQKSYLPALETSTAADPQSDSRGEGCGSDRMLL